MSNLPDIRDDDGSSEAARTELDRHLKSLSADADTLPVSVGLDPDQAKADMASRLAEVQRQREVVEALSKEVKRRVDRELSVALEAVSKLRGQVALLEEGITAANMYLGLNQDIIALRGGQAAPAGSPIYVWQSVLFMDEEALALIEDGDEYYDGIDYTSVDEFCNWLVQSDDHLDQVLPATRGVVALCPRRQPRGRQKAKADAFGHLLIRNGQQVFLVATTFPIGNKLIPSPDEFTRFFIGEDGEQLHPGSNSWALAESRADTSRRHYMKLGLLLQGLADRTSVFSPAPPELSFLTADSYDSGDIVLVLDDVHALESGDQTFAEYVAERSRDLRVGMRVVFTGFPSGVVDMGLNDGWGPRIVGHETPQVGVPYVISRVVDGGFGVKFDRSAKRWGYEHGDWGAWGEWDYQKKASYKFRAGDPNVIPFDPVEADDLERFAKTRRGRSEYLALIPMLRAVAAAKRDEIEAEAPFRLLVAGRCLAEHGVEPTDGQMDELVELWKFKNRNHRPLVVDNSDAQMTALKWITAKFSELFVSPDGGIDDGTLDRLLGEHPAAMLIVRRRNDLVVLEPADGPWFHSHHYSPKRVKFRETKEWRIGATEFSTFIPLYETEAWALFDKTARRADHLTPAEVDEVVATYTDRVFTSGRSLLSIEATDEGFVVLSVKRFFTPVDEADILTAQDHKIEIWRELYTSRAGCRWRRTVSGEIELPEISEYSYRGLWKHSYESGRKLLPTSPLVLDVDVLADLDNSAIEEGVFTRRRSEIVDTLKEWAGQIMNHAESVALAADYAASTSEYGTSEFWKRPASRLAPKMGLNEHEIYRLGWAAWNAGRFDNMMTLREAVNIAGDSGGKFAAALEEHEDFRPWPEIVTPVS